MTSRRTRRSTASRKSQSDGSSVSENQEESSTKKGDGSQDNSVGIAPRRSTRARRAPLSRSTSPSTAKTANQRKRRRSFQSNRDVDNEAVEENGEEGDDQQDSTSIPTSVTEPQGNDSLPTSVNPHDNPLNESTAHDELHDSTGSSAGESSATCPDSQERTAIDDSVLRNSSLSTPHLQDSPTTSRTYQPHGFQEHKDENINNALEQRQAGNSIPSDSGNALMTLMDAIYLREHRQPRESIASEESLLLGFKQDNSNETSANHDLTLQVGESTLDDCDHCDEAPQGTIHADPTCFESNGDESEVPPRYPLSFPPHDKEQRSSLTDEASVIDQGKNQDFDIELMNGDSKRVTMNTDSEDSLITFENASQDHVSSNGEALCIATREEAKIDCPLKADDECLDEASAVTPLESHDEKEPTDRLPDHTPATEQLSERFWEASTTAESGKVSRKDTADDNSQHDAFDQELKHPLQCGDTTTLLVLACASELEVASPSQSNNFNTVTSDDCHLMDHNANGCSLDDEESSHAPMSPYSVPERDPLVDITVNNESSVTESQKGSSEMENLRILKTQVAASVNGDDLSGLAPEFDTIHNRPTFDQIKSRLYYVGCHTHRGCGAERMFANYWSSLTIYLSAKPTATISRKCREAFGAFLITRKLRRLHNILIFSLLKQTLHPSQMSVPTVLPRYLQNRFSKTHSRSPDVARSEVGNGGSYSRPEMKYQMNQLQLIDSIKESESKSKSMYTPMVDNESVAKAMPSTAHRFENRSSSSLPGALIVDPFTREMVQSEGMRTNETTIWLLTIAVQEYVKSLLTSAITRKESIDHPPAFAQDISSSRNAKHSPREVDSPSILASLLPGFVLPSTERKRVTVVDMGCLIAGHSSRRIGTLNGRVSRTASERCIHSLLDCSPFADDDEFDEVRRFISCDMLSTASKRRRVEKNPISTNISTNSAVTEQQDPTLPVETVLKDAKEESRTRSPAVGLGRGAKDLAALKARAKAAVKTSEISDPCDDGITDGDAPNLSKSANLTSGDQSIQILRKGDVVVEPIETTDKSSSTDSDKVLHAAEAAPQNPVATPVHDIEAHNDEKQGETETENTRATNHDQPGTSAARRGKGFGIKNLAAMRARSMTKETNDDGENWMSDNSSQILEHVSQTNDSTRIDSSGVSVAAMMTKEGDATEIGRSSKTPQLSNVSGMPDSCQDDFLVDGTGLSRNSHGVSKAFADGQVPRINLQQSHSLLGTPDPFQTAQQGGTTGKEPSGSVTMDNFETSERYEPSVDPKQLTSATDAFQSTSQLAQMTLVIPMEVSGNIEGSG